MDLVERPKSALCQFDLLAQLLDPNEPKTEREHAAVREIARLRRALDDLGVTPQEARSGAERSKAKDEEITRLRTRLEIIPGTEIDGIDCRDETIRMQDAEIGRLRLVEGAQAAADERLANAAQRVGFIAGCDAADWMADEIERLRSDLALAQGQRDASEREAELLRDENAVLRWVYEAARRVLRFDGVDAGAVKIALIDMDMAIERVKLLDSGQGE